MQVQKPQRLSYLDGLRGIFALSVALSHFYGSAMGWGTYPFKNADISVDFFFVLSGFVLSYVYQDLVREGRIGYNEYFFNRVARLYPLHLLTMVSVGILYQVYWHGLPFKDGALWTGIQNILLLQGTGFANDWNWNAPSWSVSVELWVSALIMPAIFRRMRANMLLLIGIACYLLLYLNFGSLSFGALMYGFLPSAFVKGVGGICLGAAVYRASRSVGQFEVVDGWNLLASLVELTILAIVVGMIAHPIALEKLAFASLPLICVLIFLFYVLSSSISAWMSSPLFTWLGDISYALYLVHTSIILVVDNVFGGFGLPLAAKALLFISLTFLVSHLVHKYFEKPIYSRLRKLFRKVVVERDTQGSVA